MSHAIGRASVPRTHTGTIYTPDLMSDATIGLFQSLSSATTARVAALPTLTTSPTEPADANPSARSADCHPWCHRSDFEALPANPLGGWGHLHHRHFTNMNVASGDCLDEVVNISLDLEAYTGAAPEHLDEPPSLYVAVGPVGDTTETMRLTPAETLQLGLELIRAYHLLTASAAPDGDGGVSQAAIDSIRSSTSAWGGMSWRDAAEVYPTRQPNGADEPVDVDQP